MSTTTSSQRNIKSRLPTSNSINNMATNGNEAKSNRVGLKKPLSATNILQNYSSPNAVNNRSKKSPVLSNNFHQPKPIKTIHIDKINNISTDNSHHQQNGHQSNKQSSQRISHAPAQPYFFHAIAPAPISKDGNNQQVFSLI
ncbi:unnamed protein product [Rotaria socialis]|uniref:Uncharacterized protein n=1 Tax=Rotaria socialis TaxID=392032 RepID=A0A818L683_9BILA|nr:unnamed protein product [Rotaria socialis]CAF3320747.1 unnamed protein product [Rotaria socialis]CAF3369477.1 unnamed protein product [Rotaria socialis]CAF3565080.1 unnamed protein product [Rotaria socialis]CAF4388491.1 unnamed protein product [Rotaria socialis]